MTIVLLSGGAPGISILDWARHDRLMPMCRVASISDIARERRICGTKESGATFRFIQSKGWDATVLIGEAAHSSGFPAEQCIADRGTPEGSEEGNAVNQAGCLIYGAIHKKLQHHIRTYPQ
jgi:hypothetical protein